MTVAETRVKPPKVGDPIVFRAQKEGPEQVVRPCNGNHRAYWLEGYIVLSCRRCISTITLLADESSAQGGTT
jgi:hypothetical protein